MASDDPFEYATRHANEYERADHDRDLRKHDTLPSRLSPPLSTALDVAVLVKAMDDPRDGAALINSFVDAERARIRLDAVAAGANP